MASFSGAPGMRLPARMRAILAGVGVCAAALVFRIWALDAPIAFDEVYHLLAARNWRETGELALLEGVYDRAALFTIAVAGLFEITGSESLFVGRLLSLPAGVLLPCLVFFWLRAADGRTAGVLAAALAVLWPAGIVESQALRFYAWQVFGFALGAIAVFQATRSRGPARAGWAAAAALGLAGAVYLQLATAIGVAAIAAWLAAAEAAPRIWRNPRRWVLIAACATAGLAALWALFATGILEAAFERYRWAAGWVRERQDDAAYYHKVLLDLYPTLWPLMPVAALVAACRRPRLGSYCAVVFIGSFVGLSFAGMKAPRYVSFAMPFLFVIFALALADVGPRLIDFTHRSAARVDPFARRWTSAALVAATATFVAFANPFFERSVQALGGGLSWPTADWSGLNKLLGEWSDTEFRITVDELHTVAYGEDYDVLFNESRMTEMPVDKEFVLDPRTGRPVIAEPESVRAIVRCRPDGLLIATRGWWKEWGVRMTGLFADLGRPIETRAGGPLIVARWQGGGAAPEACAGVPVALEAE